MTRMLMCLLLALGPTALRAGDTAAATSSSSAAQAPSTGSGQVAEDQDTYYGPDEAQDESPTAQATTPARSAA